MCFSFATDGIAASRSVDLDKPRTPELQLQQPGVGDRGAAEVKNLELLGSLGHRLQCNHSSDAFVGTSSKDQLCHLKFAGSL